DEVAMDFVEMIGGGGAIAAVAGVIGRTMGIRSTERKDTIQTLLERIAKVEGRADELSAQLGAAHKALADEKASCARQIAQLETRTARLEDERDDALRDLAEERARRRTSHAPPRSDEGDD